jgi:hypothetical protein
VTVRPTLDRSPVPAARAVANTVREAPGEQRESAVAPSAQARAGQAEGARPATPAVDDLAWWRKQLGVAVDPPPDAA